MSTAPQVLGQSLSGERFRRYPLSDICSRRTKRCEFNGQPRHRFDIRQKLLGITNPHFAFDDVSIFR